MRHAQRYICSTRGCEATKLLPEHPSTGRKRVRTGCDNCGRITTHHAIGRRGVIRR